MGASKDYGTGADAELVPSSLRLYRHYDMEGDFLSPVVSRSGYVRPGGFNTAECNASWPSLADATCPTCHGVGKTRVWSEYEVPSAEGFFNKAVFNQRVSSVPCRCLRKCKVPERDCTCGFYASYSPGADFFSNWHAQFGLPPVFAVVEAAGRTLMGSRGVRSEKMRPVALALDYEHISAPERLFFRSAPSVEALAKQMNDIGCAYGIPTYGFNKESMIRDYPQPDLSHLIQNQENPVG